MALSITVELQLNYSGFCLSAGARKRPMPNRKAPLPVIRYLRSGKAQEGLSNKLISCLYYNWAILGVCI